MSADLLVPVDGKGLDWPRRVANAINFLLRRAISFSDYEGRLETVERRTGYGWVDYSDSGDAPTTLPAGATLQMARSLNVPPANNHLLGVFAGHQFWDDTAHVVRPRQLYDVIQISMYLKVTPAASGGVLDVSLMAGTIDIGTKSFPMTGEVGQPQGLRADFIMAARSSFVANGARVMLSSSVDASLSEFSPEFYPMGYEP